MNFNKFVKDAITNLKEMDPEYYEKCLSQRLSNGKGSTTNFNNIADLEDVLLAANWKEYKHPNITPDCIGAITTDIDGYMGMLDLDKLDEDTDCILIDPKNTGHLSLATYASAKDCYVDYTVLIIGEENGFKVMYTFHPGEPLKPSTLSDGNNEFNLKAGDHLTAKEALELGFKHVKAM